MMYIWPEDIGKALDIETLWLSKQGLSADEADWSKAPPEVQAAHDKFEKWEAIHKSFDMIERGSPFIRVEVLDK